jgi:hypothetical protein
VNYAIRFSNRVNHLTAPPRPSMASDPTSLPARSFARYKDALVPCRFSNNSLLLFCSLPLSHLSCTAPSCLRLRRAPLTPLPGPLEPIRRGQWENCRSATADSYSLDASAALSRRPSDPVRRPLTMTPMKRPAFPAGCRRLGHVTALDAGLLPFKLRPLIHHTSCLHRGRPRPC